MIARADLFCVKEYYCLESAFLLHAMRLVYPRRTLGGNPGHDGESSLTILVFIVFSQEWWGCGYSFGWCIQRYAPGYYAQEIQSKTLSKMTM
jgi:hypothetical protein